MADKSLKRLNEEDIQVTHAASFSSDEEMDYEPEEEEEEEDEVGEEGEEDELGDQEEEVEEEEEEDEEMSEEISIQSQIFVSGAAGPVSGPGDSDEDDIEEVTPVDSPKSPKSPLSISSDESSSYSGVETEEENQQKVINKEAWCKVKRNVARILKSVGQCTSHHKTCPGDECPLYKVRMETQSSSSEEDEPAVAPVPVVPIPDVPAPKPDLHLVPVPQEHLEIRVISKEEMLETPLYDLTLEQFFRLQNYWI